MTGAARQLVDSTDSEALATAHASEWLTPNQAGARMPAPVSGSRIRQLVRGGVIPPGVAARVGVRVFIHEGALRRWLAAGGSLSTAPTTSAEEV